MNKRCRSKTPFSAKKSKKSVRVPTNKEVAARTLNSLVQNPYGMGSACDMASYNLPQSQGFLSNPLDAYRIFEQLYATRWEAQKIIDLPVEDMLREGWEYEGLDDDEAKKIERYQDRIDIFRVLREALRVERLYGGSAVFIGVSDQVDDPSLPLSVRGVGIDGLKFLNTIPRLRITKTITQTNPLLPHYGRPEFYFVNDEKVHRSRLLIFDGDPLLPANLLSDITASLFMVDGFGFPILTRLYDDIMEAAGSRQAAFQLIMRSSTLVFTGDIMSQLETNSGTKKLAELRNLIQQMNIYNAALLQKSNPNDQTSLETLAANFGSVPELLEKYLQVLSAASDIPATRFLGQAPGGLNATGESDLENYYNSIAARQQHRLRPRLLRLLELMLKATGINKTIEDIDVTFPPLWNMSELEEAQVRTSDTNNLINLYSQGLISSQQAQEEAKLRKIFLTSPEDFPAPEVPEEETDFNDALKDLENVNPSDEKEKS